MIIGMRDFSLAYPDQLILPHRHLFFSHTFKQQPNWQAKLLRFLRGGGQCLDFEFLLDNFGQRVTSFGHSAGHIGLSAGLVAWARQRLEGQLDAPRQDQLNKLDGMPLLEHLQGLLQLCARKPRVVVIGADGRYVP